MVECDEGVRIPLRWSKAEQEAEGLAKGIPKKADPAICPVQALRAWREAAAIEAGPLWRPVNRSTS